MKTWRAILSGLLSVIFVLFGSTMAAWGVSPLASLDGLITDQAGALGDQVSDIEAAQTAFHQATGGNFYVVFIDSFDGTNPEQWTTQTARNANLGTQDVILVVSPGDRAFRAEHGDGLEFTAERTETLEDTMGNSLTAGLENLTTWDAAVANIIGGFQNEIIASNAPAAPADPATPVAPGEPAAPTAPGVTAPAPGATTEDTAATSGGLPTAARVALIALGIIAAAIAIIYGWGGYKRRRLEARQSENPFNV